MISLNILIATGRDDLRPFARNMLRAVAVTAGGTVRFEASLHQSIISGQERYHKAAQLLNLLRRLDPEQPLPLKAVMVLGNLLEWLQQKSGKSVPPLQVQLGPFLEEVRLKSLYYTSSQKESAFDAFWVRWEESYPLPQTFPVCGHGIINEINKQEVGDYAQAHAKAATGVSSIDNAIVSLLAALPTDAETILDIGSGPGYVNRRFPPDYAVLAMDIDEEILKDNVRQTCVGDIMAIPLPDKSVDMCMACDTLEHLTDDVLIMGVAEMERVSRKYLYLQVPFREDPLMAMACCSQCGHVWHVNHHKRVFHQEKLISLVSDEWIPILINYTGDVSYRRTGAMEAELARQLDWNVYCVENAVCPVCGGQSASCGAKELELLRRVTDHDVQSPFPFYTEIGVLFCRKNEQRPPSSPMERNCIKGLRNALWPNASFQQSVVYTGTELLPCVYVSGCVMEQVADSLLFRADPKAEKPWIAVSFPPMESHYAHLRCKGRLAQPGNVMVALSCSHGSERQVETWEWTQEATQSELVLPFNVAYRPLFVKFYFEGPEIALHTCVLDGEKETPYLWYPANHGSFLAFDSGDILYRFLIPDDKGVAFSHAPDVWLRLSNDTSSQKARILQYWLKEIIQADDFLHGEAQDETSGKRSDASLPSKESLEDNRRWIAYSLEEPLHMVDVMPDLADATSLQEKTLVDNRRWIVRSIEGPYCSATPHSLASCVVPDARSVISTTLLGEAELGIYLSCRQSWRKSIYRWLYPLLKQIKDRLHCWLHKHGRLYEFLISLGCKDLYFKLKRRIKA